MNTVTNQSVITEQEKSMSMAHPATASVEGATPSPIYALQAVIREYQQKSRRIRAIICQDFASFKYQCKNNINTYLILVLLSIARIN